MDIKITNDKREEVLNQAMLKILNALEICGGMAESYAKEKCPVDKGTLRNSIAHRVVADNRTVYIGTNVEYAPYVEFGTGIYYEGGRRTSWVFKDSDGNWHMTKGQKPQPYLKPAVANHVREYQNVIEQVLKSE